MNDGFDIYDQAGDVDREKVIGRIYEILGSVAGLTRAERLTALTDELLEAGFDQGYAQGWSDMQDQA